MQPSVKTQAPSLQCSQPEIQRSGLRYKGLGRRLSPLRQLRLLLSFLVGSWCIWRAGICSCRGHIRLQSPTDILGAGVGSAFVKDQAGCLQPNTRTIARAFYIEMLKATYNWADIVDLRIFLMGFDAGEQWTLHTADNEKEIPTSPSSWLHLAEQQFGTVADKIKSNVTLFH
jgi:hypothetical protein